MPSSDSQGVVAELGSAIPALNTNFTNGRIAQILIHNSFVFYSPFELVASCQTPSSDGNRWPEGDFCYLNVTLGYPSRPRTGRESQVEDGEGFLPHFSVGLRAFRPLCLTHNGLKPGGKTEIGK